MNTIKHNYADYHGGISKLIDEHFDISDTPAYIKMNKLASITWRRYNQVYLAKHKRSISLDSKANMHARYQSYKLAVFWSTLTQPDQELLIRMVNRLNAS